jgi:hypothetical protein
VKITALSNHKPGKLNNYIRMYKCISKEIYGGGGGGGGYGG